MEPMSLIVWVLIGAIVGWLASKVIKSEFWLIFDTIVGITGALVSGFFFNLFGRSGDASFNLWSMLAALVGSIVLLLLTRVLKRTPRVEPVPETESL